MLGTTSRWRGVVPVHRKAESRPSASVNDAKRLLNLRTDNERRQIRRVEIEVPGNNGALRRREHEVYYTAAP